jgi:hypothetical protein
MEPRTPSDRVLAYLTDADLAGGDPAARLDRLARMAADGHLGTSGRPLRPLRFLGRYAEGRLAYLCEVQPAGGPA